MSKLDNFKGKKHTFTAEDRVKGGRRKSDKKKYTCQTNAIKKGSTENVLKDCNSCAIPLCPYFEENSQCTLFNTKFVRLVSFKKNLATIKDFDAFMFNFFKRYAKVQSEDASFEEIKNFVYDFLEYREWRDESLRKF